MRRFYGGRGWIHHHTCMNEHVIAYRVIGAQLAFSFHLSARKRKERQSHHEALQSVSMNGLSREKLSLIVKLFGRSFFFFFFFTPPHVKFINIRSLCQFLFSSFAPQNVFRSGFLAKLVFS